MANSNKEVLETQILMSILLEDFDMSNEDMIVQEAIKDSDIDDLIKIADIDDDKDGANDKSANVSDEISALLNIDRVIDKIEADELSSSNDTINVNLNDQPTITVDMIGNSNDNDLTITMKDHIPSSPMTNSNTIDSTNDKIKTLNVALTNKINVDPTTIQSSSKEKEISLHLIDNSKISDNPIDSAIDKLEAEDVDDEDVISIKLTNKSSASNDDLKITIKNKDGANDKSSTNSDIHIKITDNIKQDVNDKESQFIYRRNELMKLKDPNLQLSVCIKVVIQLRDSLERLINHIPNETTLVKTKYVIGDILENILSNSKLILKDPKRMKQVVYNVFDLLISLDKYIHTKFSDIEDKVNDSSKSTEDVEISKQIDNVEKEEQHQQDDNNRSTEASDSSQDKQLDKTTVKKTPNVNKKKF